VTLDLGTGDGHFVLARAAARPDELVLGVDASHRAMVESSRRAARPIRRGGLPNARFVVAGVEALPRELAGFADLLTIHFPWGSLLHGATGADLESAERIASLLAGGGRMRLLLSAASRDARRGVVEIEPADIVATFERLGLVAGEVRPATVADAVAARSSWGRRLLRARNAERCAWLLDFDRPRA
jgi:16S rRNA (adenine(1408)-N(1))-methyltransferase